jgi:spore germination cell wall hydrolase CwlJ-like protein
VPVAKADDPQAAALAFSLAVAADAPAMVASDAPRIAPRQAAAINASIPLSRLPNPAARPHPFAAATASDQLRALDCLTEAVYYEAASESLEGQHAVAQVVLNRVRHPAYPDSVCAVVYQGPMRAGGGCQFTFTCDGSLVRRPHPDGWRRARAIAALALSGRVHAGVGLSTHYHTHAVAPFWAPRLVKTAVIGAHIFYRMPGRAGGPAAFADIYVGRESTPPPAALRAARLAAADGIAALVPAVAAAAEPAHPAISREAAIEAADELPQIALEVPAAAPGLPASSVREKYRNSGRWIADPAAPAPAAPGGAPLASSESDSTPVS